MDLKRAEQFEISDEYFWRLIMEKNSKVFNTKGQWIKEIKTNSKEGQIMQREKW